MSGARPAPSRAAEIPLAVARSPGVTAGAEIARLAGEGEQKFVGAGVAENSGEAVLEEPTGQTLADDLGDDRAPVAEGGSEALVPDEA